MDDILDQIEHLQNMRLQPNDILIVTVDKNYSNRDIENIHDIFSKVLDKNGYDNDVIIKPKEVDIEILRKEDISDGEH